MKATFSLAILSAVIGFGAFDALAAENAVSSPPDASAVIRGGTIGYALTERHWAVYTTADGKEECPAGMNDGPREQFKQLFPDDGKKRTVVETQLMREGDLWFPTKDPDPFVFKEVKGKTALGLNLDGKVKPGDFTSPEGEKGIDNQLYRAIGCISSYRGPDGSLTQSENEYMRRWPQNRFVIEISNVHDLMNDDDVTVRSYRGLDNLLTDAGGSSFIPGGTEHIDDRFGKFVQATWKGKIVNGWLITEPADLTFNGSATFYTSALQRFKGYRFKLHLTPTGAEGLMAGYVDVDQFDHQLNTSWSTHLQSYGQLASGSLYRAMRRLADGYPDPATGEMTAISSALDVKFTQVFVVHPAEKAAENSAPQPVIQSSMNR